MCKITGNKCRVRAQAYVKRMMEIQDATFESCLCEFLNKENVKGGKVMEKPIDQIIKIIEVFRVATCQCHCKRMRFEIEQPLFDELACEITTCASTDFAWRITFHVRTNDTNNYISQMFSNDFEMKYVRREIKEMLQHLYRNTFKDLGML